MEHRCIRPGPGQSPADLAAEATVCAMPLQAVARGDNLTFADQFRNWSEELRHCCPSP
jgi:hypothetical protein